MVQGTVLIVVYDLIDCKKKQINDTHNQKLSHYRYMEYIAVSSARQFYPT